MLTHLFLSLSQVTSKPFRGLLFKVIGLTLLALIVIGLGLHRFAESFLTLIKWPYVQTALDIIAGLGIFLGAFFLIAPASAMIAGLFGDKILDEVEQTHYPQDALGTPMPLLTSTLEGGKIALISLGINFIALLFLFTGIGVFVLYFANAYLMSREYFEMAAMRHLSPEEAKAMRKANSTKIMIYGLPIAALMLVPILNLTTPLFGLALMCHCYKSINREK